MPDGEGGPPDLLVVGGGLAGCEAAWQAAQRGLRVCLLEMRPLRMTPAHATDGLAELVCSNSLGSAALENASGLLKEELRRQGSLIIWAADRTRVPAGKALAVDRREFSAGITAAVSTHPLIQVRREEAERIPPGLAVLATGPLTSDPMARAIADLCGERQLAFFDAAAPIVSGDSIDWEQVFWGSRYGYGGRHAGRLPAGNGGAAPGPRDGGAGPGPDRAEGGAAPGPDSPEMEQDYVNCPLDRKQYRRFWGELVGAEQHPRHEFERGTPFFEGCLPVEELARRGERTLLFGPLKPVGLIDPRSGRRPYAVVQLRREDRRASLFNLVGFQTNLRRGEQERVFRLIPGLEQARFLRYGAMHRNTFVNAPRLLDPTLALRRRPDLLFAGQITGVEGYVESAGAGLVAGTNAGRLRQGLEPLAWPRTTALGALLHHIATADPRGFQPMNVNFGLLEPLEEPSRGRVARAGALARRALADLETFRAGAGRG